MKLAAKITRVCGKLARAVLQCSIQHWVKSLFPRRARVLIDAKLNVFCIM